jgi:hypothetical protein
MEHGRMIARRKLSNELLLELKGIPAYGLELSNQKLISLEDRGTAAAH